MIMAPVFNFFSDSELIRCFVDALSGTWSERMSDSFSRASSESTYLAPCARALGFGILS